MTNLIALNSIETQEVLFPGVFFAQEIQEEQWLPCVGFEGYYEVSNLGNVRSVDRLVTYSDGRVYFYEGTELKQLNHNKGYSMVTINIEGKARKVKTHRLVAEAFIPNFFNKPTVNHIDRNKKNNSVDNLEWATHKEQSIHAHLTGIHNDMTPSIEALVH
ncbi:NUMOD4 domain-containing protein [Bacillus paranthracis]|uniref:NUMOD4 domain-containing protein n=1 Tax=Bacillus paranthracis TaxID=2026186 RepID=UPI003D6587C2